MANEARDHGAIPMFDIYELAALGDRNFEIVRDTEYMARFWADLQLLADRLKAFDAPAIVHVEPDFWGYASRTRREAIPAPSRAGENCPFMRRSPG